MGRWKVCLLHKRNPDTVYSQNTVSRVVEGYATAITNSMEKAKGINVVYHSDTNCIGCEKKLTAKHKSYW